MLIQKVSQLGGKGCYSYQWCTDWSCDTVEKAMILKSKPHVTLKVNVYLQHVHICLK